MQLGYNKTSCRLCKSKSLFKFLDLGSHPPSDEFRTKEELKKYFIVFPLEVFSCRDCGFKQLGFVVSPEKLYQLNYPYESSITKIGNVHYQNFASSIFKNYKMKKEDFVVDIGSNVGVLLNGFKKKGCKVLGVEPASNICKIANNNRIITINYFFNSKAVQKIKKKFKKPKIITATNVFAHIDNLDEFMKNINKLLEPKKGILVIESPHFSSLLKRLEYDTIYHEHLSYLTILPLINFFKKKGYEIIDILRKDIHGGSIRIIVSKIGNYKINNSVKKIVKLEKKYKLNDISTLQSFAKKVKKNRFDLTTMLTKLKKKGKKIIALSAPAKGMTLLNYCKFDKDYIDFATEKSRIKQGLFTPGGNIPVFSDKKILNKRPDYALLLAWNFAKEIIGNNINFLKKGGKFIIPIPKVKIITYKNFNEKI